MICSNSAGAVASPMPILLPIILALELIFPLAVTCPENNDLPLTVKSSSIATVPPAESSVKSPEVVSISPSAVTPTCILPSVPPANVGFASVVKS